MTMLCITGTGEFVDASPAKSGARADKRAGYCIQEGHVILFCDGNDEELISWAPTPQEAERLVEKIRMEAEQCQEKFVTKTSRKGSGTKSSEDKNKLWKQINPGKKPPVKKTQAQQPVARKATKSSLSLSKARH